MISIVMPLYNGQRFLEDSVNSVINQSFPDWELIIVNDGSMDKSEEIARQLQSKDKRIRLFSQTNRGVSEARNQGMKECGGEYIAFLDADDKLTSDALKKMNDIIVAYSPDAVFHPAFRMSEDEQEITEFNRPIFRKGVLIEGEEAKRDHLYPAFLSSINNAGCVCCWAFKRELLNGLAFDTAMLLNEDLLFAMQCCERARTVYCMNEALYLYRDNPDSCVNRINYQKFEDVRKSNAYITDFFVRHSLELPESYTVKRAGHVFVSSYMSVLHKPKETKALRNFLKQDAYYSAVLAELERCASRAVAQKCRMINGSGCVRGILTAKYRLRSWGVGVYKKLRKSKCMK